MIKISLQENSDIKKHMLSYYCREIGNKCNVSVGRIRKYVPNYAIEMDMFFIIKTCIYNQDQCWHLKISFFNYKVYFMFNVKIHFSSC